jgi:hypothetical protein
VCAGRPGPCGRTRTIEYFTTTPHPNEQAVVKLAEFVAVALHQHGHALGCGIRDSGSAEGDAHGLHDVQRIDRQAQSREDGLERTAAEIVRGIGPRAGCCSSVGDEFCRATTTVPVGHWLTRSTRADDGGELRPRRQG